MCSSGSGPCKIMLFFPFILLVLPTAAWSLDAGSEPRLFRESMEVRDVLPRVQDMEMQRSPTLVFGDNVLSVYSRVIGSTSMVCMKGSEDGGMTWSEEVRVYRHDHNVRLHLHMWRDVVHLFIMDGHPTEKQDRALLYLSAPAVSWWDMADDDAFVIMDGFGMKFAVDHDQDHLYLSATRSHYIDLQFFRFDGYRWMGPLQVVESGYGSGTSLRCVQQKLYLFYSRYDEPSAYSDVDGHVRYLVSSDQGQSFQGPFVAMDVHSDLFGIHTSVIGEDILLFANRRFSDDILFSRFNTTNGTWSEERILVDSRGLKDGEGYGGQFSLMAHPPLIALAYENEGGRIEMIHSLDNGTSWLPAGMSVDFPPSDSRDPMFSTGGSMITIISREDDQWMLTMYNISLSGLRNMEGQELPPLAEAGEDVFAGGFPTFVILIAIIVLVGSLLLVAPLVMIVLIIVNLTKSGKTGSSMYDRGGRKNGGDHITIGENGIDDEKTSRVLKPPPG